jgi:hypothetical protein
MPNCIDVSLIQPAAKGYPPLAWQSELGQIATLENVRLHACTGEFSTRDVEKELHRRTAVKIWSGHGAPNGLLMPNGLIRRAQWLATHAKVGLPRLVVIAACYSQARDPLTLRSVTEEISRAGMNVIGYIAEAEDASAVAFNVALISALAVGAPVTAAFDVAMEEITGSKSAEQVFYTPAALNGYADVVLRLEALEDGQKRTDKNIEKIMTKLGIPIEAQPAAC